MGKPLRGVDRETEQALVGIRDGVERRARRIAALRLQRLTWREVGDRVGLSASRACELVAHRTDLLGGLPSRSLRPPPRRGRDGRFISAG